MTGSPYKKTGGYDYLPIDAKQIGRERSNSSRTQKLSKIAPNYPNWGYGFNNRFVDMKN